MNKLSPSNETGGFMKILKQVVYLLILVSLLSACGGSPEAEATTDVDFILTAGVETLVASFFQTQTALYTPPVDTNTPEPSPTPLPIDTPALQPTLVASPTLLILYSTPIITGTPTPTGTYYTATPKPSTLAVGCNNLALVYAVTVPDGTTFNPGESFNKTWKVENNGTCDWEFGYRLSFSGGDRLNGDDRRLGKVITPGKWTEISVKLEAPRQEGTYTGYWRMANIDGDLFGATLSVTIKVKKPPAPTSTVTTAPPATAIETFTASPTPSDTPTP